MTLFILTCISAVIISVYLIGYIRNFGIPTSISDTYYHTVHKWQFPLILALSGGLELIPFIDVTPEHYKFLAFLSIAAIFFVAASPAFKEELVGKVHAGASILLGLAVLAWLILTSGVPYIAIAGTLVGVVAKKNYVFWLEVGLLTNLYCSLIQVLC